MIEDKKIRTAIWKTRLPSVKGAIFTTLLVSAFAFAILHKTPIGPTREVVARVEAIGVTHGADGSGVYLVCVLNNGQQVKVFLDNSVPPIQKGQMIKLRESSHLMSGGKTYQLVNTNSING